MVVRLLPLLVIKTGGGPVNGNQLLINAVKAHLEEMLDVDKRCSPDNGGRISSFRVITHGMLEIVKDYERLINEQPKQMGVASPTGLVTVLSEDELTGPHSEAWKEFGGRTFLAKVLDIRKRYVNDSEYWISTAVKDIGDALKQFEHRSMVLPKGGVDLKQQ